MNEGRTGVERGAYQGASVAGIPITGFVRQAARDELGVLPPELAQQLTRCAGRSKRRAVQCAVDTAAAVLVLVPDPDDVSAFPVVQYVLKQARRMERPVRVHAAGAPSDDLLAWLRAAGTVYITGPRETRWPPGVNIARRLIRALGPAEAIA